MAKHKPVYVVLYYLHYEGYGKPYDCYGSLEKLLEVYPDAINGEDETQEGYHYLQEGYHYFKMEVE